MKWVTEIMVFNKTPIMIPIMLISGTVISLLLAIEPGSKCSGGHLSMVALEIRMLSPTDVNGEIPWRLLRWR